MPAATNRPARTIDPRLGQWLKAKRLSIRPQDFGLTVDKHRAPGLTQLELSRLVTVDDRTIQHIEEFTRIPSPATLAAIATGLRLSEVEHAHLDRLARPGGCMPPAREDIAPIQARVAELANPAVLYDETWTVLAHNPALASFLPGFITPDGSPANLLIWYFTSPEAQRLFVDWADVGAALIARLRATQAYFADTAPFDELVAELCARSPYAAGLWREGVAVAAEPSSTTYRIRDADGQVTTVAALTVNPIGSYTPCLRIVVCLAPPRHTN